MPLVSIGLGFDLVNSEHNQRTLSRVLSQPIYRDALLFGKFLAGLATMAISLIALWLLLIGIGLFRLGIPPGGEEIGRALIFLLVTIAYWGCGSHWRCSYQSCSARRRPRLSWRSGCGCS